MTIRTWRRDLARELEALGIEPTITPTSSGHLRINLSNGEVVYTSSTPSDWRSLLNVRAQVRRAMRGAA
jgi:hypothetical protein